VDRHVARHADRGAAAIHHHVAKHRGYVIENGRIVHSQTSAELLRTDVVRRACLGPLDVGGKEADR
jgi:ABC-type lipopolysaccharide export system ATPase subunit